jgi:hypothetical protein
LGKDVVCRQRDEKLSKQRVFVQFESYYVLMTLTQMMQQKSHFGIIAKEQ